MIQSKILIHNLFTKSKYSKIQRQLQYYSQLATKVQKFVHLGKYAQRPHKHNLLKFSFTHPSYQLHDYGTLCLTVKPKRKYWEKIMTGLFLHLFSIHQHNPLYKKHQNCSDNKNRNVSRHFILLYSCKVVETFDEKFFICIEGTIINRIAAEVTFQLFRCLIEFFTYLTSTNNNTISITHKQAICIS